MIAETRKMIRTAGLICCALVLLLTSCMTQRSAVTDLSARLDKARAEAHRSVVTIRNETGGTSTTHYYYGVDAYMALLRDTQLSEQDHLLVAESAEANLGYLSTHRCEMETVLAEFYFDRRNYGKAAQFSDLVLTTAGAMLETHRRRMVTIRFVSLYREGRYSEVRQFIDGVIREEALEKEYNKDWLTTLTKWREELSQKNHNKPDARDGL
jgi:hypothetical protein